MRILFTRFPLESRFGGAEVQTLALMKGLRDKGHEVAFLGSCPVLLEETAKLKIENVKLKIGEPPVTKWGAIRFLWRKLLMKKKLYFQFSIFNFQFDAVCMLSLSEKLLLTPFLHKQGIKTIWIEHDRVGPWLTHNPWLPKLRKLSKLATTVVVSDLSKKMYEQLGFQNVIAIPNGIDASRLKYNEQTSPSTELRTGKPALRQSSGQANQQTFHVGTLARLSYDKGIDVLMDAVKDLPDVALTMVGTGPEQRSLKAQMANGKWQMANRIIPHVDDLSAFYTSLDLFVLPSRSHDPFGLVAGEAMLMGIPVIVTDACGIAGYLKNNRDAVIVKAGSAASLRDAIVRFHADTDLRQRIGDAGRKTAEEKFSMKKMVDRYEELLA